MSTAPRRLGKYELRQPLGRGHVGIVWQAYDVAKKQDVALKILHSDLQADPRFLDRFQNIGQSLLSLHQDNLINIYDTVVTRPEQARETTVYLTMDLISGYTLSNFLQASSNRGAFPPIAEIAYLFQKLGAAVDYLHLHGIVHGDIKPTNILLDQQRRDQFKAGEPVLTDVSMTLIAGNDSALDAPHYIAPEQAQGQDANSSSDIYSLGVLLYELCTGVVPFRGESAYAVIAQQINTLPAPPILINANIPSALSSVILRSLAKDSGTRFQSATALARAVAEACSIHLPGLEISSNEQRSMPGFAYPTNMPIQTPQSILGVPQPQQFTPSSPAYMRTPYTQSSPLDEARERLKSVQAQAQNKKAPGAQEAQAQMPNPMSQAPDDVSGTAEQTDETVQNAGAQQSVPASGTPNPPSNPTLNRQLFAPRTVSHNLEGPGTPAPQSSTPSQAPISSSPDLQGPGSFAPPQPDISQSGSYAGGNAYSQPGTSSPGGNAYFQSGMSSPGGNAYSQPGISSPGYPQSPYSEQRTPQEQRYPNYGQPTPPPATPPQRQAASTSSSSTKTVSLILLALVVILGAVFGITHFAGIGASKTQSGNATTAATAPGTVFFQDSPLGHDDELRIIINNVPAPASGQTYAIWMQTQQETQLLDTVSVQGSQINYNYAGNDKHSNLLANMQGLLVTSETAGSKPQSPSTQVIYSGSFDSELLTPLRSVLYQTPELGGDQAVPTSMFESIKSLNDKAGSIVDSLQNTGDTGLATRQATRILEMIDGTQYAVSSGHLPKGIPTQLNVTVGLLSSPQHTGYIDIFEKHLNEVKAKAGNNTTLLARIQNTQNSLDDVRTWSQQMEHDDIQLLDMSKNASYLKTSSAISTALQLKQLAADTYTGRVVPPNTSPTSQLGSAGSQQAYTESQYMAALPLYKKS